MKDLTHQFKIALAVKQQSLLGLSEEWGVSHTYVRQMYKGWGTNATVRAKIEDYIADARRLIGPIFIKNEEV